MRIALVSDTFYPNVGGTEFVLHHLATEWELAGHKVCVFNMAGDQPFTPTSPYQVQKIPWLRGSTRFGFHRPPFLQYTAYHLKRLLDAFKPDAISVHYAYPAGVLMHQLGPHYPHIITLHGKDITAFEWGYRRMYPIDEVLKKVLTDAKGIVALSSAIQREIAALGVPTHHVVQIPNGVELERFSTPVATDLRTELKLPADARILLSVGRVHPAKAFDVALDAFAKVAPQHPNAYYLMVGKGASAFQAEAQKRGIAQQFIGLEPRMGDALTSAYQQADIYFSSSKSEVLSLALLEAMAAGQPVVATRVSGTEDVVLEGQTGFLLAPGDATGMAQRIDQLLRDEPLRQSMKAAGLQRIQTYSWKNIAQRYLELFPLNRLGEKGSTPAPGGT